MNVEIRARAQEDLQLIREIMERTADSVVLLGRPFILAVAALLFYGWLADLAQRHLQQRPVLYQLVSWGLVAVLIWEICYAFSKPAVSGLAKQLRRFWMVLFAVITVLPMLPVEGGFMGRPVDELFVLVLLFAVGFFVTGLFMDDRVFHVLAALYGLVLPAYLLAFAPRLEWGFSLLDRFLVPLSFLLMGGYLEWARRRRGRHGSA